MKQLGTYRQQHAELFEMVGELRPLLNKDQLKILPVAKTAHTLLCDISEKLKVHLDLEDKELYPSLLTHEDPKVKSIAWGYLSGERSLRKSFSEYSNKWLQNCDFEFSDQFIEETNELLDALAVRVEREEKFLFPKLERLDEGGTTGA